MSSARNETRVVLGPDEMRRAVTRIAHEILERNGGTEGVMLAGIVTRGAYLAARINEVVARVEGAELPIGRIDATFHRDDLAMRRPQVSESTDMPASVEGATVVLVDDVIFTGRTVRAALDELVDFGRPRAVQLAVLVDRGHRELPIRPDFVGKNMPTSRSEDVRVLLEETDGRDAVLIQAIAAGGDGRDRDVEGAQ